MSTEHDARLIIPDIHHKISLVDRIRGLHPDVPAIFLGDYFDDFNDTAEDMEATCRWLQQATQRREDTFLLGNHCFAYLSSELGIRWGYCSGWTATKQQIFHRHFAADTLLRRCGWILACQGWLISHAGITRSLYQSFSKRRTTEEILEWVQDAERALTIGLPHPAFLAGADRGGTGQVGGLLWCDWETFQPVKGLRQIVGHTPANEVRFKRGDVCLDTHLHHYGLLRNGELTVFEVE